MARKDIAAEFFSGGFNCAAAVLACFCEDYELETELAAKLACGLGGGCHLGDICGAASGGILVVGLKYGQYIQDDLATRANCAAKTTQFLERFMDKHGAATCRELLGCDIRTEEGMETVLQKKPFCAELVNSSVEILEELGY